MRKRIRRNGTKGWRHIGKAAMLAALFTMLFCLPVYATAGDGAAIINTGFDAIYTIIAAIVSSIGALFLLWGLFEWAQALNTQDGGAQSMAFKRIASGLVATLGPQLIPVITSAMGR